MFSATDLQPVWYGDRQPPLHLRAIAALYGVVVGLRSAAYSSGLLRRTRLPVPVVVIGNINAGGTGKTPLALAVIEALRARGYRPGVISRGHGGSARVPMRVDAGSDPAVAGDEPCLIARASGAPVAIGRSRVAAARLLLDEDAADVLIADDGLQHYALGRDVEICVIDGVRRFGNGRLLPAGPLREPAARAAACTFRVCNGATPAADEIAMQLEGADAFSLDETLPARRLTEFAGQRVHAVAGIGNPARFFSQLRAAGIDIVEHAFDDHHAFAPADIAFGDGLPVLMTEKDAVKCAEFAGPRQWFVPVVARLPEQFFDALAARLRRNG